MPKNIPLNERIIFALDVPGAEEALALVRRLESRIGFFKVGLQLFLAAGFDLVDRIGERGNKVMLDLKFHDIPKTVESAMAQVRKHDIALATVHGYAPTVAAAAKAKGGVNLLAVTVLTSMGQDDLARDGRTGTVQDLVENRARTALSLGADGVVCSGLEAAAMRELLGPDALIVTPGVRPTSSAPDDDQTRIAAPGQAVAAGADHLVVGRPIRDASAPEAVIEEMQGEIEDALRAMPPAAKETF